MGALDTTDSDIPPIEVGDGDEVRRASGWARLVAAEAAIVVLQGEVVALKTGDGDPVVDAQTKQLTRTGWYQNVAGVIVILAGMAATSFADTLIARLSSLWGGTEVNVTVPAPEAAPDGS